MTGRDLYNLRRRAGLTRKVVAERLKIHPNTLYLIEKEKTKFPQQFTVDMINEVYELEPEDYYKGGEKNGASV